MLQLYLSDQQIYCQLRCDLYWRFYGYPIFKWVAVTWQGWGGSRIVSSACHVACHIACHMPYFNDLLNTNWTNIWSCHIFFMQIFCIIFISVLFLWNCSLVINPQCCLFMTDSRWSCLCSNFYYEDLCIVFLVLSSRTIIWYMIKMLLCTVCDGVSFVIVSIKYIG